MITESESKIIKDLVKQLPIDTLIEYSGSRVICDPIPMDTDIDVVIYSDQDKFVDNLIRKEDFKPCYGSVSDSSFYSYRKGTVNIIHIHSKEGYDKFMLATGIAKRLNLTNKDHRIILFQSIRMGVVSEWPEGRPSRPTIEPGSFTWHVGGNSIGIG